MCFSLHTGLLSCVCVLDGDGLCPAGAGICDPTSSPRQLLRRRPPEGVQSVHGHTRQKAPCNQWGQGKLLSFKLIFKYPVLRSYWIINILLVQLIVIKN